MSIQDPPYDGESDPSQTSSYYYRTEVSPTSHSVASSNSSRRSSQSSSQSSISIRMNQTGNKDHSPASSIISSSSSESSQKSVKSSRWIKTVRGMFEKDEVEYDSSKHFFTLRFRASVLEDSFIEYYLKNLTARCLVIHSFIQIGAFLLSLIYFAMLDPQEGLGNEHYQILANSAGVTLLSIFVFLVLVAKFFTRKVKRLEHIMQKLKLLVMEVLTFASFMTNFICNIFFTNDSRLKRKSVGRELLTLACVFFVLRPRLVTSYIILPLFYFVYIAQVIYDFTMISASRELKLLHYVNIIFRLIYSCFIIVNVYVREKKERDYFYNCYLLREKSKVLEHEIETNEKLIYNVFPRIVRCNMDERLNFCEKYDVVIAFQSDIVGYTKFCSEQKNPVSVMKVLNYFYGLFDKLVKITAPDREINILKTVGDAFVAIVDPTIQDPDKIAQNATRMLMLGFDFVKQVRKKHLKRSFAGTNNVNPFRIRVGVAAGPGILAIIGNEKITCDLFGPITKEVKICEQNSRTNRVSVNEEMITLLPYDNDFEFRARVVNENTELYEVGYGQVYHRAPKLSRIASSDSLLSSISSFSMNSSEGRNVLAVQRQTVVGEKKSWRWVIKYVLENSLCIFLDLKEFNEYQNSKSLFRMTQQILIFSFVIFGEISSLIFIVSMFVLDRDPWLFWFEFSVLLIVITFQCSLFWLNVFKFKSHVFTYISFTLQFVLLMGYYFAFVFLFDIGSIYFEPIILYGLIYVTIISIPVFHYLTALLFLICFEVVHALVSIYRFSEPNESLWFSIIYLVFLEACILITEHILRKSFVVTKNYKNQFESVETNQKLNNKLLSSVLPRETIAKVKSGETNFCENKRNATACFIHLSFENIAIDLMLFVQAIDMIFSKLDEVVDEFNCSKVKSIENEYLLYSTEERNGVLSILNCCKFVFDFVEELKKSNEDNDPVTNEIKRNVRVKCGICTGTIYTNVVGGLGRFLFDCFGDTINTAARLAQKCCKEKGMGDALMDENSKCVLEVHGCGLEFEKKIVRLKGKGKMNAFALSLKSTNQRDPDSPANPYKFAVK